MKYSKGDKVRIKSIDWYNQMLSIPEKNVWRNKLTDEFAGIWCGSKVFYVDMCKFCGNVMTIQNIGIDYYIMEEDSCGYEFTDEMIVSNVPKFKKDDRVETNDGLFGYITEVIYDKKVCCYQYYVSFIVDGGYYYEDQLKLYKKETSDSNVPKFKVGDIIVKKDGLTNRYLVTSVSSEYYGLQIENGVGVLSVKDQDEWELLSVGGNDEMIEGLVEEETNDCEKCGLIHNSTQCLFMDNCPHNKQKNIIEIPDGYIFKDENGNVINATKIVLEKKKKEYPKTYEECRDLIEGSHVEPFCADLVATGYMSKLMERFARLIMCRNAYWLTAGREMGLEGKWEPDWSDCRKFSIVVEGDKILTDVCLRRNRILVFPTEEMRDEFLKVFRNYIEECKEFL